MQSFKTYLTESFNIPLSTDKDIDAFETKLDKKALKILLKKIKAVSNDIPFAGDASNGKIKVRGGISGDELDSFRKEHNIAKSNLLYGMGTIGRSSEISGAEWEQIICVAYNMSSKGTNKEDAITLAETGWKDNFDSYMETGSKIIESAFKSPKNIMKHYGSGTGTLTKEWNQYFIDITGKPATSNTKTPKTDMYISSQHISLKKAGGSQLMSGAQAETAATLAYAYKNIPKSIKTKTFSKAFKELLFDVENEFIRLNLPEGETITTIKRAIKAGKKNKYTEIISRAALKNKSMTKALNELSDIPEVREIIVREAMTGENKFSDGISAATHMMVFDETGNASYTKINEKVVKKYASKIKFDISFKSARNSQFTSLRLVVNEENDLMNKIINESFETTEKEMLTEGVFDSIKTFLKKWANKIITKILEYLTRGLEYFKNLLGMEIVVNNNPEVTYSV